MHRCSALEPRARSCQRVLHAALRAAVALAASSPICLTAIAGAADHTLDVRTRSAAPDAFIYINYATGERIVSTPDAGPLRGEVASERGTFWSWSNRSIDPCAPDNFNDPLTTWVFTKVHDEDLGDDLDAASVGYWHDWFEHSGDTIIDGILLSTFVQIPDVDSNGDGVGDGVVGLDWFLTFTENDGRDSRHNAVAHSPILISELPGSLDDGASDGVAGDGEISFQEGQIIISYLDFGSGDLPTDIEVGDTNGVSDGRFGDKSIFSGVPGIDTDGDGLINSGFVIGFRQPGVSEGDGLLERFPELAGIGLENPDGPTPDPSTFPNIRPAGFPLAGPSDNIESYQNRPPNQIDWPYNPSYTPNPSFGEGVGGVDGYALIDAEGIDTGLHAAGFFACDPDAKFPPFTASPWFTCDIWFNPFIIEPPQSCNPADNAEPFFVLDLADIAGFVTGFQAGCNAAADIAPPFGVCDLADISLFVTEFQAGCP